MTKKILFRADGNSQIGLGHLYRLIAFADICKNHFQFKFITKKSSITSIIRNDYEVVLIPEGINVVDEPLWLCENFNPLEYLIILDGYYFNSGYQKDLKSKGYLIVYIDDLMNGKVYADVLINHAPSIQPFQYEVMDYTRLALGTDFAILRKSFIKAAQSKRKIEVIKNAIVCFGGADPMDLSYKATKALVEIDKIKNIYLVLGAAYNNLYIEDLAVEQKQIKIYRNLDEETLFDLMASCQIAVAPSSTIVYELCAIKMLILSGYFADNQKNIYKALLEKGAIYGAGDFSTCSLEAFKSKLLNLINQEHINHYLNAQQKLFDGQSPFRLIKLLNDLLVSFRKATKEDLMLVYNWSNDPLVRKNSYNVEEIDLENHQKWFERKINDDKTLFLIALYENQPAGIVRYESEKDHTAVGVLIAEEFRGKKLSPSFLSESAKIYFKHNKLPIFAYIKKENKASIKAFENGGYRFHKNENVKDIASFVYKLEFYDDKR